MARSLLAVLPSLAALTLALGAPQVSAAPGTCVPKGAKTTWHKYGVRTYFRGDKWYACANRYAKRFRLEPTEWESDAFSAFRTNGRYLFYVRHFEDATTDLGSIGRLIDLKSGHSTKHFGPKDIDYSAVPECAPVEVECRRSAAGAAIGPGRSFVIGYEMRMYSEDKLVDQQFWVERHCFGVKLATQTIQQLDRAKSLADLASIKSVKGKYAQWTSGGVVKTAPFSC